MKKLWINDILETKRCILRIPEESEAETMWNLITEDTTMFMIWDKWEDISDTKNNLKETREKCMQWKEWQAAIYEKQSWNLIWRCWINKYHDDIPSFEIGYWVNENYYGKWIIPECVMRYLEYAFEEEKFEKVIIRCDSKNKNSTRVAEKCGFIFEWEFKKYERVKWEIRDTKFFWITREEYFAKK